MSKRTISDHSIFGEYKKTEDRVTAALLHVINEGGQLVVERLFGDLFDIPSNNINVIPQSYHGGSNPDGELSCDCKYNILIESKIKPNDINAKQLKNHISLTNPAEYRYLIYLTPDKKKPRLLQNLMVEWLDWHTIIERLLGIIADEVVSDLVIYLIKQFIMLIEHVVYEKKEKKRCSDENEGDAMLLEEYGKTDRVIIVGGHWGEDVALDYCFYACQPYRYFKPASYIAFYHQNRIKYLFEIIGNPVESTRLDKISKVITSSYLTVKEPHYTGDPRKYFELKLVKKFDPEIKNDKKDKNGKPCAFVQGHTYTTYHRINNATKTSQL